MKRSDYAVALGVWGWAIAAVLGIGVGTAAGASPGDLGEVRKDDDRAWTLVMYLCGDNNLEAALLRDINSLEGAIPEKGVDVIVLMDRSTGYTTTDGDWTGGRVYRIRPDKDAGKIGSELLADCGELNMGDPATLSALVASAIKTFPAKRYAVFLSDHGAGWTDCCNDSDAPGADGGADELSLPEVRSALREALGKAGVKRLDMITLDMCLMAQLEVAAGLKDLAQVVVFSEAEVPNHGLPNEDFIADFADASHDAPTLAKRMVAAYQAYYDKDGDPGATLSAVDCDKVQAVVDALNPLAAKLAASAQNDWPTLCRSLFFAETYEGRTDYRRGTHAFATFDLLDVLKRIRANSKAFAAEDEFKAFQAAHAQCVLARYAGPQRRMSTGLAVYAPIRAENLKARYGDEAGTKDWAWLAFLNKLHALQQANAQKPKITDAKVLSPNGEAAKQIVPLTGGYCTFELEGTNILWLILEFCQKRADGSLAVVFKTFHVAPGMGQRDEESAAEAIDLIVPVYPDGKHTLGQELGGIVFQVHSGGKAAQATVEMVDPGDALHATAHGLYTAKGFGDDIPVDIQFSVNDWRVDAVVAHFPRPGGGTVTGRITPDPNATVKLLVETEGADGKIARVPAGTIAWGDGPQLVMNVAQPGEHALFVRAESIAGSSSYLAIPFQVVANKQLEAALAPDKRLTLKALEGDWQFQALQVDEKTRKASFADMPITVKLSKDPKSDAHLLYQANVEGDKVSGIARLDTRGVPLLSFFVRDEAGDWLRGKAYIAIAQTSKGQPTIVLKDISASGDGVSDIQRMIHPGADVENTVGPEPGPGPGPAPGGSLVGKWQSADGTTIVIGEKRYEYYEDGELVDKGTYTAKDGKIVARTSDGETVTYDFKLDGDKLTLENEDEKVVLKRQK